MYELTIDRGPESNGWPRITFRVEFSEYRVFVIQQGISNCCGLSALQNISPRALCSAESVDNLITYLKTKPWASRQDAPFYNIVHLIFTTGMGPLGYGNVKREDVYKHLIARPEVSLIHRYPSASEPGHDVGIFMLELK